MAFVTRKFANAGELTTEGREFAPVAAGAVSSPQGPGQVPDRSTVPNRGVLPVPPSTGEVGRPATEEGSAQEIMGVFDSTELDILDPRRFEQAPPTYEEQRKASPSLRQPLRPQPGYALSAGIRIPGKELAALSAEAQANQPTDPSE